MVRQVTFRDSSGVEWRVREVTPPTTEAAPPETSTPPGARLGWLYFEAPGTKRLLTEYPADWQTLPPEVLAHLCGRALPVPVWPGDAQDLTAMALVVVRCALAANPPGSSAIALGGATYRMIRALCDEAHRQHEPAERLIIALRRAWASLPEVRRFPRADPRAGIIDRVITLCIQEYYTEPG